MLFRRSLLVCFLISFIYNSVYLLVPNSQFIPPFHLSPLVTLSLFSLRLAFSCVPVCGFSILYCMCVLPIWSSYVCIMWTTWWFLKDQKTHNYYFKKTKLLKWLCKETGRNLLKGLSREPWACQTPRTARQRPGPLSESETRGRGGRLGPAWRINCRGVKLNEMVPMPSLWH